MLLATVLGGGMSSRLFTEVRERRGLAYYIYGYNQAYTDAGTLFAQGGVDIQRIDEAVADDRRASSAASPPSRWTPTSWRRRGTSPRAASSSRSRTRRARSPSASATRCSRAGCREPDEVLAALDRVTLEDVQRVAQDIVREERLNLAVIGPFDDPAPFEKLLALSA